MQSTDTIDLTSTRQTYTIELTASNAITDMSPILSETQTFTVTVVDTCPTDDLSAISNTFTSTYLYYIDEDTDEGVLNYFTETPKVHTSFTANWATSVMYCPIEFEIVRDYDDTTAGTYEVLRTAGE